MDHWDKYGFRVCDYDNVRMYRPKDADSRAFDCFEPLRWLHDKAKMGLAIDPYASQQDYAEGVTCEPFFNWGENAALELNMPFSLRSAIPKVDGAPLWLANRFVDSVQKRAPYYAGGYYDAMPDAGWGNNSRILGWYAEDAEDQLLAEVQQMIRRAVCYPNLISHHLPQQEIGHGSHDMLTEWGPEADASYRQYLRKKYGDLKNLSQRWHGSSSRLASWADVHVPELAEFEGWSAEAIDIGGAWKVRRLTPGETPPAGWQSVDRHDSAWETVRTPGSGMMLGGYKAREPAIFRIRFAVPEPWLKRHARPWLYVWDLNPWDT
jgi:hypothetical protein